MHRTEKPQQLQWRFKRATLAVKRASRDAVQKVSNISFLLHWTLRHSPRKSTLNNRTTWNMTTRNLGDSEFASMTVFTWQSTLDTFFCAMYMSKAQLQNMLRGLWPRLGKERVEKVSQQGKYIYVRCLRQKSVFFRKRNIGLESLSKAVQYSELHCFTANHNY